MAAQEKYAEQLQEGISRFSCQRDIEIEEFLKNRALEFEIKGKSRTYLLLDEEKLLEGKLEIVGFFSIAPQIMYLPEELSIRQIKKLDGFSGKIHGERIKALPVYLIGQLAKNDRYKEKVDGKTIISYAFSFIYKVYKIIGGRIIIVDVKTEAKGLIRFYERNGFKMITSDTRTGLSQLVYMIQE